MKRALIIVATLIVLIGTAVAVYFMYFAQSAHLTVGTPGDFNDAAGGTANTSADTSNASAIIASAGTIVGPNFVRITSSPVSGGEVELDIAPVTASTTTTLPVSSTSSAPVAAPQNFTPGDVEVRYIDRQSGNVYAYRVGKRSLTRISDKTLPGIQEASWTPDGTTAFVRFLAQANGDEHIDTYALPYNGSEGYFLEQDLAQAFVTGSSTLFTLTTGTDSSIGSVARTDGSSVQTLFTSPLTSIVARAAGSSVIAVTKASSELDGYAFSIAGGRFTPLLGPLPGLTALPSPSGKKVLFSYVSNGSFVMGVLDLTTGSTINLPLATPTEKCVWTGDSSAVYCGIPQSLSGNLPDDWYQGATSFSDRIWRIDLNSRLASLVLDPTQDGNTQIDAVNLTLDPNASVLVFRNKIDSSLWAYSL